MQSNRLVLPVSESPFVLCSTYRCTVHTRTQKASSLRNYRPRPAPRGRVCARLWWDSICTMLTIRERGLISQSLAHGSAHDRCIINLTQQKLYRIIRSGARLLLIATVIINRSLDRSVIGECLLCIISVFHARSLCECCTCIRAYWLSPMRQHYVN